MREKFWDDKTIGIALRSVMTQLDIDRLPTQKELKELGVIIVRDKETTGAALFSAISTAGGFEEFAEIVGVKFKNIGQFKKVLENFKDGE